MAMKFLSSVKIESLKLRYNTMNEFYRKPFFMTKYAVSVLLSQGLTFWKVYVYNAPVKLFEKKVVWFSIIMERPFELV